MKRLRDHGLSLTFLAIFILALAGQAIAGHSAYNNDQLEHGGETISLGRYLTSSNFGQAVMENWQSEYLQFTLFIVLTAWLIQRGSPESKEPGREGLESDEEQRVGAYADERPSAPWSRCRSSCASGGRRSRSPWARRTTPLASRGRLAREACACP